MSISSFISKAGRYMPGVSVTDILSYLDTVQGIMFGTDSDSNIYRLPDGNFPFVGAESLELKSFDVNPANLKDSNGDALSTFNHRGIEVNPRKVSYLMDSTGNKVLCQTYKKTSSPPLVKIIGDYIGDVKIVFYIEPPKIENINNDVYLDLVQDYKLILDGVVGLYEDRINGRSERLASFYSGVQSWSYDSNEYSGNNFQYKFTRSSIG